MSAYTKDFLNLLQTNPNRFANKAFALSKKHPEAAEEILRSAFEFALGKRWVFAVNDLIHEIFYAGFSIQPEVEALANLAKDAKRRNDQDDDWRVTEKTGTLAEENDALGELFRRHIAEGQISEATSVFEELLKRRAIVFSLIEDMVG